MKKSLINKIICSGSTNNSKKRDLYHVLSQCTSIKNTQNISISGKPVRNILESLFYLAMTFNTNTRSSIRSDSRIKYGCSGNIHDRYVFPQ